MYVTRGKRKMRNVQVGFMRGLHKSSIRQGNVDRVFGTALVYDVCVDSSKIVGSASISYGCG